MSGSSTTVRGVSPSPIGTARITSTTPTSKPVQVVEGRTYELRTDAQVVDGDTGAVTYPLVYVTEGGGGALGVQPGQGAPFSRDVPLTVTPRTRELLFSADVACNVWVLIVDDGGDCGCGCGGKGEGAAAEGIGPVPKKKGCGCRRA